MALKIQIETISPGIVEDLKKENQDLRNDIKKLQGQYNSLYETLYSFMEKFAELRRSIKERQ